MVSGVTTKFYEDAEAVLVKLPRRGVPMILRELKPPEIGLPSTFTLDACRRGMTELEEAELTDGQGRALSGHKTKQAYAGYANKRWNAPCPRRGAPLTAWRTPRERIFRMSRGIHFRMPHTATPLKRCEMPIEP
jgi:hypothetical protein